MIDVLDTAGLSAEEMSSVQALIDRIRRTKPCVESEEEKRTRGQRMAEILSELAARGVGDKFPDPVTWQREIRKDRPLPGRD